MGPMSDTEPETQQRRESDLENLQLLQAQVDALHAENLALSSRIRQMHTQREELRVKNHEKAVALAELRNRPGYRMRALLSDVVRGKVPVRSIGDRIDETRIGAIPPEPLSPARPAFANRQPKHLDVFHTTFPDPAPRRPDLRVAVVLDTFSQSAFSYEFESAVITPENWEAELVTAPDLLFVESSFGGNSEAWRNQIAGFCPPRQALSELTYWCRKRGIPTVFWNKEDPINFDWFIGAASAFDWVFTVDADSIPRYREALGHDRIGVLPFAAQPAIHYPPPDDGARDHDVAFAGSYYARKHPERRDQMEAILAPALDFGLDIYDRMGHLDDPRFGWPDQYRGHIRGSLSYPQTTEAYRRYKVFLNINTITDSPTMCARRVFELLASGTPVVSGPSRAIEEMVPADAIRIARSKDETKEHLEVLLSSGETRSRMADAGLRWIRSGNSVEARVDEILETIGIA